MTTEAPRMKPLAAAETAVRRLLLMIGFGFMAFVGGSTIAVSLTGRIASRLEGSSDAVRMLVGFLVEGAWVMFALPAIGWIAGRFLDMKPWSTGIIGAATGLTFQFALQYVSTGSEGIFAEPVRQVSRLVGVVLGVLLTAYAVKRARAQAQVAEDQARLEAEQKKTQYDEFVQKAQELADRREAVPIAAAATAPETASPLPERGEGQGERDSAQTSAEPAKPEAKS